MREYWLNKNTELERHRISKIYMGRLIELQYAEWIETKGWKVTGLEALGNNVDIVASNPEGVECGIEVKYLGEEDNDFLKVVESLSGGDGGGTVSPYAASDFVLFKVHEAAKQLLEKK